MEIFSHFIECSFKIGIAGIAKSHASDGHCKLLHPHNTNLIRSSENLLQSKSIEGAA